MANLVMHLGSGNADESDASLDVLAGLVEHHLAAMAPFAIFFKVRVMCFSYTIAMKIQGIFWPRTYMPTVMDLPYLFLKVNCVFGKY